MVVVNFGKRSGSAWAGQVVAAKDTVVSLGVTPSSKAIVGLYRMYVAEKDPNTNFTCCSTPGTRYSEVMSFLWEFPVSKGEVRRAADPSESALNIQSLSSQFEEGVLDACIYIMDACRMPIHNRGDVVKMVRTASALINSQDDNGVLIGNWSDDFSMGTPPTTWTGSVSILQKYHNSGAPVSFAQCWVYAGVLNTFLRCLGIPSRVVTNFNSAHDNTGNLKTELIFKPDGTPDRHKTQDSIWNFHCWNEAFMKRVDLPPKYSGWQVVDATPQETNDRYFRCGPAPVIAIRDGELCHPFDCRFVFAEVNSDLIHMKSDKYGNMTPFKVDTSYVGQFIYTKSLSSWRPEDITRTYKHPEGLLTQLYMSCDQRLAQEGDWRKCESAGSLADQQTMALAEQYGCSRDRSDWPASSLSIQIATQASYYLKGYVGDPLRVSVTFYNQSETIKSVKVYMEISSTYYTGVVASDPLKVEDFRIDLDAFQSSIKMFELSPQEYVSQLGSNSNLEVTVTGQTDDVEVSEVKTIALKLPPLNITLSGRPQVNRDMYVMVSFTNTLGFPLTDTKLAMEGAGLLETQLYNYRTIPPMGQISHKVGFRPTKPGLQTLLVVLDCDNLPDMMAMVEVKVMP
ncbi:coagulation factor XIII A chain-like [Poeciliopsis prolifica]|uniref:coagulation factor XIII A chain-like n=1 Tax=Poeciliopsis prolifica TaxID=188132 RepID=UPI002414396E|nr:coagulation factor XIII A chain-like [Poeciliopsis prolifica]